MGRLGGPVHLQEPGREPEPVAGCDVCGALDRQRSGAYAIGDKSRATDCNVEIRRHPHRSAAGER
ncbi:hypothetical protein [Streptomyces natalensis]|uniref:Uncharacterized protein n=1 Tax=Streptomyces natalensis ATCC 27448 TaxID=1240678 RepID=A0A0D7CUP5_9ACTN|nr:hypothetical protein [Streptomyces natalensis]KIZ19756.1 hypothetical protein SNA_00790 [Streptomyces natalensis ATCC 27448]